MDQTWILTDLMMMETWKYVELKGIVHLICRVEGLFVHLMRHWSGIIPKHPALVNSMNREASGKQYEHCAVGV